MKKLFIITLLGVSFAPLYAMEKPALGQSGVVRSENDYANTLWNGNLSGVRSFLQGGAHADYFVKVPGEKHQRVGGINDYTKSTPIIVVWTNDKTPIATRLTIIELLLNNGADANKSWRNTRLFSAANAGDAQLVKWLLAHGAQDPQGEALAEAQTFVDAGDDTYQEVVDLLKRK